jgi:hypothetical protein
MKTFGFVMVLWLFGTVALWAQTPTADQLKSGLIGHTMGGRYRCWKFQSIDQIKELTIKGKTEKADQCTYLVALRLQATNSPATYAAQALVACTNTLKGWTVDHVGLLSLQKIK